MRGQFLIVDESGMMSTNDMVRLMDIAEKYDNRVLLVGDWKQHQSVVPAPDSGVCAALGYSREPGMPFRHGLIRNHYVGRTFIEPSQAIRDFGVKLKLNPVRYQIGRAH